MRLLLIGPPGSGKGTQAKLIAARYGIEHISSGDLLRRHVDDGTPIGRAAKEYMDRGDLVPDSVVMDILRKPVEQATANGGYLLDGFPRTVAQAEAAYLIAKPLGAAVRVAIYLDVSRDELTRRVLGRVSGRSDDTADVVANRLKIFDELTAPLLDYYADRETLLRVDGDRPVEEITATIFTELDRLYGQSGRRLDQR